MLHGFIKARALAVIASRPADFVIGPPDDPYMLRWWCIPRNRFVNIYVHWILHDDDDRALHDHPWASLSYLLEGELTEHYKVYLGGPRVRSIKTGQWVYRSSRFAHRLVLGRSISGNTAITLFMTGPRVREWGFHCPKGWVHWKDFVASDDAGAVGRGCGEGDVK